ncbi:hypothetical protein AAEX28_02130 [Lentisphaerota bacterium WC36G]|nr:hypothetical protein LJT99_05015 [Lentisphaerae bacterium WC36]
MKKRLYFWIGSTAVIATAVFFAVNYIKRSEKIVKEYKKKLKVKKLTENQITIKNLAKYTDKELQSLKTDFSNNLLAYATNNNKIELVKYLLKRGFNPIKKYFEASSALECVIIDKNYDILNVFINYADQNNINIYNENFAWILWRDEDLELVKFFEKNGLKLSSKLPSETQIGVIMCNLAENKLNNYIKKRLEKPLKNNLENQYEMLNYSLSGDKETADFFLKNGVKKNFWFALADSDNSPKNITYIKEELAKWQKTEPKNKEEQELRKLYENNALFFAIFSNNAEKLQIAYQIQPISTDITCYYEYLDSDGNYQGKEMFLTALAKKLNKPNAVKFLEEKLKTK